MARCVIEDVWCCEVCDCEFVIGENNLYITDDVDYFCEECFLEELNDRFVEEGKLNKSDLIDFLDLCTKNNRLMSNYSKLEIVEKLEVFSKYSGTLLKEVNAIMYQKGMYSVLEKTEIETFMKQYVDVLIAYRNINFYNYVKNVLFDFKSRIQNGKLVI